MFGGEDLAHTVTWVRMRVGIRPGGAAVGAWGLLPAGEPQPSRMGSELCVWADTPKGIRAEALTP